MIVRMAQITVVTLAAQREEALRALQRLGVLHVHRAARAEGTSAATVAQQLRDTEQALRLLGVYAGAPHAATTAAPAAAPADAAALTAAVLAAHERLAYLDDQRAHLQRQYEALGVWGDFDPAHVAALKQRGIHVKLYQCEPEQVPALPAGCVMQEVHRAKHLVSFVVIGDHEFALEIPETPLPAEARSTIARRIAALDDERGRLLAELSAHAAQRGALARHAAVLGDELACAQARDSMGRVSALAYLTGFCPADAVPRIEATAHAHGWGILISEPGPDAPVPTLIRNPRWLRPVEAVFQFIDTYPGYRERDISGVFYVFFSLFYAMLIGDACYGLIFLALTAFIHLRWGARIPRQPLYLMYVLNACTVVYGVLTGSYFGITLPEHAVLRRWAVLDSANFSSMVFICFMIAAAQLIIARVWNIVRMINSWKALSEAGWALVIVGAYFVANQLILGRAMPVWAPLVGVVGLALALGGTLASTRGEELVGELFQFPFKAINCFGDIASYMRLFAVGFAGAAMAQAFNAIASQIGMRDVVSSAAVVLILAVGHALNLVLGLLSVMVHGLRLNMLEFSGHLGQEWTGIKYEPLAQRVSDQ